MQENAENLVFWGLSCDDEQATGDHYFTKYVLKKEYGLIDQDQDYLLEEFVPGSEINADHEFVELSPLPATNKLVDVEEGANDVVEPCAAASAIEANIPTPAADTLMNWRTFINSAYYHPNILAHDDVACLKELFHLLGSKINYQSINIMIDLRKEGEKEYKPVFNLRPSLPSCQNPPSLSFAQVKQFLIDDDLKVCMVKDYAINTSMKNAVFDMVNFIIDYPEALYLETYGFILDFFLRFRAHSEVIIDTVMRTQRRRMKSQRPASVLVLKQAKLLGKGRSEFLQQRLLRTADKRYDPIVPFTPEPVPVRHLRNRKIGSNTEETLESAKQSQPVLRNEFSEAICRADHNPSSTEKESDLVQKAKRKLFDEKSDVVRAPIAANGKPLFTQYRGASGNTFIRRQKRFYNRRDNSIIEKPFICSLCAGRSFAYKGNMVLHMKKHHPNEIKKTVKSRLPENYVPPFYCPVCNRGFSGKYKCKAHIVKLHPDHSDWHPVPKETEATSTPSKGVIKRKAKGKVAAPPTALPKKIPEKTKIHTPRGSTNFFLRSCTSSQDFNIQVKNVLYEKHPFSAVQQITTRQQVRMAVQ